MNRKTYKDIFLNKNNKKMGVKIFFQRFKNLPDAEAMYYLIGKILAVFGLGILFVHWFRISSFIGWLLLVIGIALALHPGVKIMQSGKSQKEASSKAEKKKRR